MHRFFAAAAKTLLVLPTFGLPAFEVPKVEGWSVPTLLIAGGVALGILLGMLGALLAAIAASSRLRRTRKLLTASVRTVVQDTAVAPLVADLDRASAYTAALAQEYIARCAGAEAAVKAGAADLTATAETLRGTVISALDILSTKRVQRLPKKHGNLSL